MNITSTSDLAVYQKLKADLNPHEEVLWVGRPKNGVVFRPTDFFLIPFAVFWTGFAVFWETSVNEAGAPLLFGLWGIPFVLIGVYLLVGRFFYEYYQRRNSFYAVTKTRVILRQEIFPKSTKSLALDGLGVVELSERAGGVGDVVFQGQAPVTTRNRGVPPKFDNIADAARVYRMIAEAQAASQKSGD